MTHLSRDWRILLSLALPILVLTGLALDKHWNRSQGTEIRLAIEGFDPRDLLSGHFLTYKILYDNPVCPRNPKLDAQERETFLCLRPKLFSFNPRTQADSCTLHIQGVCHLGQFTAGIERFYIPEQYAHALDLAVRNKKGEIIVNVTPSGTAQVKELLLEGRPWREMVQPDPPK